MCDSTAIVNARAAEEALLNVVAHVLYTQDLLDKIAEKVRRKLAAVRQQTHGSGEVSDLHEQLAHTEQQIGNVTAAIAEMGPLEDLKARLVEVRARRQRLQAELSLLQTAHPLADLGQISEAVTAYTQRLPALLRRGHVEEVKDTLLSLVSSIYVFEAPELGNGKAGARLLFRGNLEGTVALLGGKVKIGGSPGGLLPPLRFQSPPRRIRLHLLRRRGCGRDAAEPRRAVTHG